MNSNSHLRGSRSCTWSCHRCQCRWTLFSSWWQGPLEWSKSLEHLATRHYTLPPHIWLFSAIRIVKKWKKIHRYFIAAPTFGRFLRSRFWTGLMPETIQVFSSQTGNSSAVWWVVTAVSLSTDVICSIAILAKTWASSGISTGSGQGDRFLNLGSQYRIRR